MKSEKEKQQDILREIRNLEEEIDIKEMEYQNTNIQIQI